MFDFWKNLSVTKKLYCVVGLMAVLIGVELYTLRFAVTTLSAVRAFVGGEGLWSKAQKSAINNLQLYALTGDETYFKYYLEFMKVPLGDHQARQELEKPTIDMQLIANGFVAGNNHPEDIEKMVDLVRRFHRVPYIAQAIEIWSQADGRLLELVDLGEELRVYVQSGYPSSSKEVRKIFEKIKLVDRQLTELEDGFSRTLGEASRWLENLLVLSLFLLILVVESTGIFLAITFARNLSRGLKELNQAAERIGEGNFTGRVPIYSQDELGQLGHSLNTMTSRLQNQILSRMSAEQASKTKNLFLANMSHEIRTPLNAVLGFAELLHAPNLTQAERDDYLHIIKRTGGNLTAIIDDILDITKIEAGEIEIETSAFSLSQLMSDIERIHRSKCEDKKVALNIHRQGVVADSIKSDVVRLRQILTNIIGNSVKFTAHGQINVVYGVESGFLIFDVEDTGIGITDEQLPRLFQPFSQGDDSVRKKHGGTGLGLQISQRLAKLMGGDLQLVQSEPKKGSTFRIVIPYRPSTEEFHSYPKHLKPIETRDWATLKGKRILVCEDSPDNQYLANRFLSNLNVKIDFVENGEEALAATKAEKYDVILMDMQMPIMDGFTATQALRQRGVLTPIIAITGYAMSQDRERCLIAGCNDFLAKPYNRNALLHTISRVL